MEILKPTCFDSFFSRSTKPTENGEGSKGKQDKQVHVHDEQEKASDDADKDIGRLSKASCEVKLNTMSDEVENDWMEVKKKAEDQEGIDKLLFVQIMLRGPLRAKVVDESQNQKFLVNQRMQRHFINCTVTS